MTVRIRILKTFLSISLTVLLLGGCNLLQRGDYHRSSESSLVFKEIGFLASDNPGLLYRNAVTQISSTDTYIEIIIPYYQEHPTLPGTADTTTPLVPATGSELAINFDIVAKDAVVTYAGSPVTSGDSFSFHDGTNPIDRIFDIQKTDPLNGETSVRTYTVSVRKLIYPKVTLIDHPMFLDPPAGPPKAAAAVDVHFVDELGNTIPQTGATDEISIVGIRDELWLDDGDGIQEEDFGKRISVDFDTWQVNPDTAEHRIADAKLYGKGQYRIVVPPSWDNFTFADANGYKSQRDRETSFTVLWDPDAIYMATWGSAGASGLSSADPVPTLVEALAAAIGSSRFDIKIAEGTYDCGTGVTIASDISIYGGFSTDFSKRWDMDDPDIREAHASTLYGRPPAGTSTNTVNGVLTYNPIAVINPTSILDGVVVFAADSTDGGNNFTAALVLKGASSPEIITSTFVGGGGGGLSAYGVALQNNGGTPIFRENIIVASQVNNSGENAGLLSFGSVSFWVVGNLIRGSNTSSASSYGVRLLSADAELHGNDIRSGNAALESIGLSAVSSPYLRGTGNRIGSKDATASIGVSLDLMSGPVHLFNNVIGSGIGNITAGIRTIGGNTIEIINNAILTGSGATGNQGLFVTNLAPGLMYFINNLVDSESADLMGIETDTGLDVLGMANFTINNNAFDDGDGSVEMQITGGLQPTETLTNLQNTDPGASNLRGNIEKKFIFNGSGWITSGLDANIAYGGDNGFAYSIEPGLEFLSNDQRGRWRSQDLGSSGWSIGPIEYDESNVSYPRIIHLAEGPATGGPGSDKYVLGTEDYPFESFGSAYAEAEIRTSVLYPVEVHVAEGDYYPGSLTLSSDMRILGGYNDTFTSRNYSTNVTTLITATPGLFTIDFVSSEFILEGFTFRSEFNANAELFVLQNGASPHIRHNVFESSSLNTEFTAIRAVDAYPIIYDNDFIGGMAAGKTTTMIFEGNSAGEFRNNTVTGGSPLTGDAVMMEVRGSAAPWVHDNVMTGEAPVTGEAIGVYFSSNAGAGSRFERNTIFSGDSISSDTTGFLISGMGADPTLFDNNIISGDSPGSRSTGIGIENNSKAIVLNNDVFVGTSTDVIGIAISNAGNPVIEDNTVNSGITDGGGGIDGISILNSNPVLRRNTIQGGGNAIGGGSLSGITLQTAAGTVIEDNNRIMLGQADVVSGVHAVLSPGVIIDDLTISGGTAQTQLFGIQLSNSDITIMNSTINPGSASVAGLASWGVYSNNWSRVDLYENTISGGTGDISNGLYLFQAPDSVIRRNTILGNQSGTALALESNGVYLDSSDRIILDQNTIFGGEATQSARGVYTTNSNEAKFINNLIHAGSRVDGDIRGMELVDGNDQILLYNNTIYAGISNGVIAATRSVGIHTSGSAQPRVINNLIIAGTDVPANESIGFWQQAANIPSQFLNNIIIGVDAGAETYRDPGGVSSTSADLDTLFGGPSPTHGAHLLNIGEPASAYLQRFTANGGESAFLSDNWHLRSGGSLNALDSGLDLSSTGDFFFDYDREGAMRTPGWSIGAYEY